MKNETKRHRIKFFINKFEAIPATQWCSHVLYDNENRRCALGHTLHPLTGAVTEETGQLMCLFESGFNRPDEHVANINNGVHQNYQQPTPRQRMLAALHDKLKECL